MKTIDYPTPDADETLTYDRAATAPGANNGGLTLWMDGVQQSDLSGVDNDTRRVNTVRLGAVAGLDSTTLGTYYFDALKSRRTTCIGLEAVMTITYTHDPLYRLKRALYTDGSDFNYTYDAVGNRLSQTVCAPAPCTPVTTSYTYDAANRPKTVTQGANSYSFAYNGLSDQVQQTVNSVTTYTLDLAADLTQVLADGTNLHYLYGVNRIREQGGGNRFYLGGALG